MRLDFCLSSFAGMADLPGAPRAARLYADLHAAGFAGVQAHSMAGVREAGLAGTGFAMVAAAAAVDGIARAHGDEGFECTTLVCGNGLEDDTEAARFAAAILEAGTRHGYRLLLETHRASVTQDIRRTLDLIARFPELRFTGDFSHWYVGHELALGDFAARLDALQPLIERTGIVEGRIGSCNQAQLALEGADDPRHFVAHHRAFWTRCFAAMIAAGREPVFMPQLLPAVIRADGVDWPIGYAATARGADGRWHETSDRWEQSLLLCRIAQDCECAARAQLDTTTTAPRNPA